MWLFVLMSFLLMGLGQFKIVGHNEEHQQISSVVDFHALYLCTYLCMLTLTDPETIPDSGVNPLLWGISIQRLLTWSQQEVVQYRAKQDGHFLRKHVTWLRVDSSKKLSRLQNQTTGKWVSFFSKQPLYKGECICSSLSTPSKTH